MSVAISGLAAVFDHPDRAGDVFRRGAFAQAGAVPLLVQHRGRQVGTITALGEDGEGLRVAASVTDEEAARLVRAGALPGLSVGFRTIAARQGARREILRAALVEVSLVAVPMHPRARITRINTGDGDE